MNKLELLMVVGLTALLLTIPTIIILVFIGFAYNLVNLLIIATCILAVDCVVTVTACVVTAIVKLWESYYYTH